MITIFNRRRLWLDASAEAAARVWSALEAAGIPYEVKTLRSHSTFGRKFHAGMGYEGFQGGRPLLGHGRSDELCIHCLCAPPGL